MANAGSICDLDKYTDQNVDADDSEESREGFRSENLSRDTKSH